MRQIMASVSVVVALCSIAATLDTAGMQQKMVSRFGSIRVPLLHSYFQMIATTMSATDDEKIKRINDFFNQSLLFESDISVWQQSDYWATPLEFIGMGRGDCEDYSIAKYYSLRLVGVPVSRMRFVYVKANRGGGSTEAHMVLAYYSNPTADPVILDNLESTIRPASQRTDLAPVFSFNSQGIYSGVAGSASATSSSAGRLSRWEDLQRRVRAEGFID